MFLSFLFSIVILYLIDTKCNIKHHITKIYYLFFNGLRCANSGLKFFQNDKKCKKAPFFKVLYFAQIIPGQNLHISGHDEKKDFNL